MSGSQAADPTRPEVERWLAEAREQFNRNQILTPEDDNAVLSYKRALKLDPSNAQALQGLEEVVARIDTTVTELISRGDMANARLALTRALEYFPERERFKLLERRLSPES